jgi:hypothetical protein
MHASHTRICVGEHRSRTTSTRPVIRLPILSLSIMEIAHRRQEEKRHVRLATRCPLGAIVQRVPPNVIKVTKDICMVTCRIVW